MTTLDPLSGSTLETNQHKDGKNYAKTTHIQSDSKKGHMVRQIPRLHTRRLEEGTYYCTKEERHRSHLLAVQDYKGEEVMPRRPRYTVFSADGKRGFFIFKIHTRKQRNLRVGTGANGVFGIFGVSSNLITDPKKVVKFSRRKK